MGRKIYLKVLVSGEQISFRHFQRDDSPLARANAFWTAVGEADSVSFVPALACTAVGQQGVHGSSTS